MQPVISEREYIESVVYLIGGERPPNESMKSYLARVFLYAGVSWSCGRAAYYEGRMSNQTRQKFEEAAQSVRQTHDLVAYAKHKLIVWRKHPELYRLHISATCRWLAEIDSLPAVGCGGTQLEGYRDGPGRECLSGGDGGGFGEAAECAMAPA